MEKILLCITILVMFGTSSAFAQDDYFRHDVDKTETVHDKIIPPPLKQMKMGIKLGHIICDEGMTPTWNIHFKPACVFPDSEMKLLERGWAKLRLVLPASGDPIKELEWTGQNEVTYRILGNVRYGDEPPPSTLDEKKKIVWEYAQQYHSGEKFLEYSIPTSGMYHFNVGDKVQFDLLEWGNYSECWDLKLRIIDIHDQPVYEDNSVRFCLEPSIGGQHGWFASYSTGQDFEEFVCDKAGYYRIEVSNGEIFPPTILKNFACFDKSKIEQNAQILDIEKFLTQNQIDYRSDRLIVTGGISTGGDPGCGVVMDTKNQTHWFAMNSVSYPTTITLYSENPNQCIVNTASCFCNAQMELAALTLDELSYFSPEEEEKFADILIDYLNKENINTTPKFKIGKFNLNYTNPSAIGYCGELWGYNKYDFFDGAIVDNEIKDYGLAGELSPLCAISNNAKWWERDAKQEFMVPDQFSTGHKLDHIGTNGLTRLAEYFGQDSSPIMMFYGYCNCTKSKELLADEEMTRTNSQILDVDGVPVVAYPNVVDYVNHVYDKYVFVFYYDGYRISLHTNQKLDVGLTLVKELLDSSNIDEHSEYKLPSDFSIVYSFGIGGKNIFDSAQNHFLADMVCDPPIRIPVHLSDTEKQAIWQSVLENDFFSFGNFTQNCDESGQCLSISPEEFTTLSVTWDGKTHTVQHRGSYLYNDNEDYLKFEEITNVINDVLRSRDDFKNIPSPRCAYQ